MNKIGLFSHWVIPGLLLKLLTVGFINQKRSLGSRSGCREKVCPWLYSPVELGWSRNEGQLAAAMPAEAGAGISVGAMWIVQLWGSVQRSTADLRADGVIIQLCQIVDGVKWAIIVQFFSFYRGGFPDEVIRQRV